LAAGISRSLFWKLSSMDEIPWRWYYASLPTLTEEMRRKRQGARQSCIRGSRSRSSAPNGRKQWTSLSGEESPSQTPRMPWRELSPSGSSTDRSFATRNLSFWTSF
ncbi:unnamed protein product, partial [Ectocarpus sp. 12 AP-2014]